MGRLENREATDDFRAHLSRRLGLSSNSVNAYLYDIGKFRAFLDERDSTLEQARTKDIRDFISRQADSRESPRSTARALTALRRFYEFLKQDRRIPRDPAREVSMPTTRRGPPRIISRDRIEACLNSFREDDPLQFRNKLICILLYHQALRISELCEIKVTDLAGDLTYITIASVPPRLHQLSAAEQIALRAYLKDARPRVHGGAQGEYLFPSRTGGALHRKSVWRMLRKHLERRGLGEDLTPRVLRHSRAVHLLLEGAETNAVRALLGNVDAGTMRKYTRLARSGT